MTDTSPAANEAPRPTTAIGAAVVAECYGNVADEYAAARNRLGVVRRAERVLVRVTGKDRKPWLHNLLTNDIKSLAPGSGCYAFAIDLRGRVLFDVTVLDVGEELWVLTDSGSRETLLRHLERYHISEDVALRDAAGEWACLALIGPGAEKVVEALAQASGDLSAAAGAISGANYSHVRGVLAAHAAGSPAAAKSEDLRIVRDPLCAPVTAFEIWASATAIEVIWKQLIHEHSAEPIGHAALDALRIEAGVPWMHRDIDGRVVAPETGQAARAISYRKGCYLGQEVIERMRSHGSQARRLVRFALDDGAGLSLPAPVRNAAGEAGRITSLIPHPAATHWIGLGYLKAAIREAGGLVAGDPSRPVTFTETATP